MMEIKSYSLRKLYTLFAEKLEKPEEEQTIIWEAVQHKYPLPPIVCHVKQDQYTLLYGEDLLKAIFQYYVFLKEKGKDKQIDGYQLAVYEIRDEEVTDEIKEYIGMYFEYCRDFFKK